MICTAPAFLHASYPGKRRSCCLQACTALRCSQVKHHSSAHWPPEASCFSGKADDRGAASNTWPQLLITRPASAIAIQGKTSSAEHVHSLRPPAQHLLSSTVIIAFTYEQQKYNLWTSTSPAEDKALHSPSLPCTIYNPIKVKCTITINKNVS